MTLFCGCILISIVDVPLSPFCQCSRTFT